MSYTSTSKLPKSTSLNCVIELIELLGYELYESEFDIPGQILCYRWHGEKDFQSFVGVEIQIYQKDFITVDTRTRLGRSWWDLRQQNKTIKALKDFFGGSFVTDEGRNILFYEEDEEEPSLLEAGLYLRKWSHHNDLVKLGILNMNANINAPLPTKFPYIEQYNSKIIFNNLQIPFLVGVLEEYLKTTFVVLMKCLPDGERSKIFKRLLNKVKVLPDYIGTFSKNSESVEWLLTEYLSFQRPKTIVENFMVIDSKIDINSVFMKPTSNQKGSLFERVDKVINIRNNIVHHAEIDHEITDDTLNQIAEDFNEVANRIYYYLCDYYKLKLTDDSLAIFETFKIIESKEKPSKSLK
jgi:hypothetical protein